MLDKIPQTPKYNPVREKVLKIEREVKGALEFAKTVGEFREQYHEICKRHDVSASDPHVDFNDDSGRVSQSMVQFLDGEGEVQIELITAYGFPDFE